MKNIDNKINFLLLFFISISLFLSKWIFAFSFFPFEDITSKIINFSNSDSSMYFHYVKSLSKLNFNNIFHTDYTSNSLMPFPIGSILFHTFFFKIFGIKSFIFLELASIFFFLSILL